MKTLATIKEEGQITLPLEVRQRLGLKEGDEVAFVMEDDKITLTSVRAEENPFLKYAGILGAFATVEEVNNFVAELRDEE